MKIDGRDYSWTQPCCGPCFTELFPKSQNPHRLANCIRVNETCCQCGLLTHSGLYIRINPRTVPHPTPEEKTPWWSCTCRCGYCLTHDHEHCINPSHAAMARNDRDPLAEARGIIDAERSG